MKCSFCGAENPENATSCSVCLRDLGSDSRVPTERFKRTPEFHPRIQRMIPKTKTVLPVAAGGILVMDAVSCLAGLMITNYRVGESYPELSEYMGICNTVIGGLALIVLMGGILAMLRKGWGFTLAASVVSFFLVLMFGFLCGIIGAFLSVAALVLLIQSRDEFARDDRAD